MTKVHTSAVLDAPIEEVWSIIRDFNGLPTWVPMVAESHIEGNRQPNDIGAIRNFQLKDGTVIREQLLSLSEPDHCYTYRVLDTYLGLQNLIGTLRLSPVPGRLMTLAEWSAEFQAPQGNEDDAAQRIGSGLFQRALDHLKVRLDKPPGH